ncbi:calcium-translocating P-type ATPase, SERCA-type [Acidobacteriota bacterium]
MDFYNKSVEETLAVLNTTVEGLPLEEARSRRDKFGPNILEDPKKISVFRLMLSQFSSPLIWILFGAAGISLVIGEAADAAVIGVIILLNALVGFLQEYNAERAIEALKRMASMNAVVQRDGREMEIDAADVVPGDVIKLEAGFKVPADARLFEIANLQTQESSLTGESLPVQKNLKVYKADLVLGDQKNMVFAGTTAVNGRGTAIVTSTGMDTRIGKVASLIQSAPTTLTPLQKQLRNLGKWLGLLTLAICSVVFLSGIIKGEPLVDFFFVAVSLAVAAIPEGLPAVVTVALALGIKKMARRNALIRKLPSVETLGSTTIICTDKTGTLTLNEMTVKKLFVDGQIVEVEGLGYEAKGTFSSHTPSLTQLLKIGALNNDAQIEEKEGSCQVIGDPTEGALLVSAAKSGLSHESLEDKFPRVNEVTFSSERKRMTTVHRSGEEFLVLTKGAPDILLPLCKKILDKGRIRPIEETDFTQILQMNQAFAQEALRVLGFAYREASTGEADESTEQDLIWVGLQGMIDPPRPEIKDSINKCRAAGIRVVMITGDFMGTAVAIAHDLGIKGRAVSGEELRKIDLDKEVSGINVYARVNPEDKLRIVETLQKKGYVVAMTGDGINDAPALKTADIGIAMGITGTDVAKEASDMILLDDNFTSIVSAVEEGRAIFDNIRKFVNYLLSSNIGEVLVVFVAILMGLPLPLLAVQILWINLITDGLPALALGIDPPAAGIMERKPRPPRSNIMSGLSMQILFMGFLICLATLFIYWKGLAYGVETARTMAFTTLVILEIVRVQLIRINYRIPLFANPWLWAALAASLGLQMIVVYTPFGRIFQVVPLDLPQLGLIVAVSAVMFAVGAFLSRIKGLRPSLEAQ